MSGFMSLRIERASDVPDSAVNPSYWLRIEQEREDDLATTGDVAEVADALYDIDPCIVIEDENSAEPEEETAAGPDEEKLLSAAREVFGDGLLACRRALSGDYTATARLYRSHPAEGYRLVLSAGEVVQTVVASEQLSLNIDIKGDTSVELEYPVDGPFAAGWLGLVIGASGIVEAPEIKRSGNTLYWTESVTGTIRVEFATQYDLITFEIPGIPNSPGSELGMPQDVKLLAFYHMMVFQGDIQAPAGDDTITADYLLRLCGYMEDGGVGTTDDDDDDDDEGPLPEPPPPPEYGCQRWDDKLASQETYKAICCHYDPTPPPPSCLEWTEPNPGGKSLPQEVIDKYLAINPNTSFHPVAPSGAEGCGTVYYHLRVDRKACCDDIPPLEAHPDNPTSISAGGSVLLKTSGGDGSKVGSWVWTASAALRFVNGSNVIRGGAEQWVFAASGACANNMVRLADGCSVLTMPLSGDAVPLEITNCESMVVAPGGYVVVYHTGGVAPYTYSSDTLINAGGGLFYVPLDACGQATVAVSDSCADVATCQVKITVGKWETVGPEAGQECAPVAGWSTANSVLVYQSIYNNRFVYRTLTNVLDIISDVRTTTLNPAAPCDMCPCGTDHGSLHKPCDHPFVGELINGYCLRPGNDPIGMAEFLQFVAEWVCP